MPQASTLPDGRPLAPASGTASRRLRAAGVVAATLTLAACSAPQTTLNLEARDAATRAPAAGLTVIAETPSNNHPFSISSLLGQTEAVSTRLTTDAAGAAVVTVPDNRPLRLTVLSPGADPQTLLLDPLPTTPTDWLPMGATEVRVGPPAAR
jgi:hypothetical protein